MRCRAARDCRTDESMRAVAATCVHTHRSAVRRVERGGRADRNRAAARMSDLIAASSRPSRSLRWRFGCHFGTQPRACVWNASMIATNTARHRAAALSLCHTVARLQRYVRMRGSVSEFCRGRAGSRKQVGAEKKSPKERWREAQVEGEGEITPCCA